MTRLLVVTAVAAERDAVLGDRTPAIGMLDGLEVHRAPTPAGLLDVACLGVGAVAAAVGTSCLLGGINRGGYDLVLSAGIAGGFAGVELAALVVADSVVHADLGAETADGEFSSMAQLGWGAVRFPVDQALSTLLASRLDARCGAVLTVSTVTGSQQRADRLLAAYPDAIAEAMEGVGVCQAADRAGVRFGEVRAVSNPVGPRDRGNWAIKPALAALGAAFDQLLAEPLTTGASR
jgi:futalosine hydrolase